MFVFILREPTKVILDICFDANESIPLNHFLIEEVSLKQKSFFEKPD